jgi:hypothetical protein
MCLVIEVDSEMQQAPEDIICYKILERIEDRLFTPYRRFPVDIESKILTSKGEIKKEFGSDLSREFIGQGVIHTFAYLEDVAVESLSALHYGHKYEVYECIIPKETFYYTGLAFGVPSYGSICIKFIKRVDV